MNFFYLRENVKSIFVYICEYIFDELSDAGEYIWPSGNKQHFAKCTRFSHPKHITQAYIIRALMSFLINDTFSPLYTLGAYIRS